MKRVENGSIILSGRKIIKNGFVCLALKQGIWQGIVNGIRKKGGKRKMKCQLCISEEARAKDRPNFDDAEEHLIITKKGSHYHIHGPVKDEYVMRKMIQSLLAEMEKNGMPYYPSTGHRIGD